MIELPGWNDLISVNGFCYSSSMGESPKLNIPLKTSVAPTKGIAPATFARNSTATYIDANGVLQTAAINVPRFQNGRYLAEPAATNIVYYSQDLTQWNNTWSGGVNITSGYTIAGLTAFKINQIDNLADAIYNNPVLSLTGGTKYYVSVFIKNVDSTRASISVYDTIKGIFNSLNVSFTNGIPSTYSNQTTITEIAYTALPGLGEYLVSFSYTVPSGSSLHRVFIHPEVGVVATNSLIVTGLQVATLLTSYIPTTSAPVTRAADALHYDVSSVITQGQGSLYCEFWDGNYAGSIRRLLNISDGTNSNRLYPYIKSTGGVAVIGVTGGSVVINVGTINALSTLNKMLLCYENNSGNFYLNGVLVGSDTDCIIPTNFTTLSIGCSHDGTLQLNSEIGNVKYFKEVLTPAEAIKLTTV